VTAIKGKCVGAAILFTAMLLSSARAAAQEPAPSPVQVREALRLAIELYKRGDYERAAEYFQYVQKGQPSLARPEQEDLTTFGLDNANALHARQEGAQQLRQANDAFQKGKINEAGPLLNALNSNQFLSPADKQQLDDLNRRMQTQLTGKAEAPPLKGDAKTFLANGRAALQAGDLNAAEGWANQAEKASSWAPQWIQPFSETPAKLRRDIQAARAKLQQPPEAAPKKDPENKDSSWLPNMKWFAKNDKQADPAVKIDEPTPIPKKDEPTPKKDETPSKFAGFWPFGGGTEKKDDDLSQNAKNQIARQMVADGFLFLQNNELDKAHLLATKAKEMNAKWDPNERTPDLLLHEIRRRSTASQPPGNQQGGVAVNPGPTPMPPGNQPPNFAVNPGPTPPFPGAPDAANPPGTTPTFPKPNEVAKKPTETDPRVLVRMGRALLAQKKIDEADKVCAQANGIKTNWGLWEDNPEKLRKDITSAKRVADRDESVKLLVEARKLMAQGKLDEAEKDTYKAKQLHGPYGVFDFGDRPDKLLEEIAKAKQAKARENPAPKDAPKDSAVAKNAPKFTPPPDLPPGIQSANKNRAIVMIREGRELERKGMLVEARQKALEARALHAPFQPDEDSPEHLLTSLNAGCDRQISTHLNAAVEAFNSVNDPQRFDKAQAQLSAARQLAQVFQLDPGRVDQTTQYLHQAAAGGQPVTAIATDLPASQDPFRVVQAVDAPTGDPRKDALRKIAREKLRDAQIELSHGRYAQARKMAEDLYNPAYGIQEEVVRFLRTINAEETNQEILAAIRNFEVGLDALTGKTPDYRKAMAIFQQIDPMMLPEKYQVRLRDIMGMRQMQPDILAKMDRTSIMASTIEVKQQNYDVPAGEKNDLLDEFKAGELVQYQALRARGVEALRKAHELWKQDRPEAKDQALATLKAYIEQVNLAGLEQPKSNELRRAVDTRIQQYTAMQADAKLNKAEQSMRYTSFHDESARTRKIMEKQGEIAAMMKNAQELLNERKYKEAEAEARKVREIDPDNGAALALLAIAQTNRKQERWDHDVHQNERIMEEWIATKLADPDINDENPVGFDRRIMDRRKAGEGHIVHELRDPKERAIQRRLKQSTSLRLRDVPLKQAVEAVAMQSGLQIVPDDLALQEARINMDSPLSISVEDIELRSALNILLRPLRLTYIIEDQVLKITTENRTVGRLVRVTYPVGDLIVPVEDHPLPDIFNIQKALEKTFVTQGFGGNNFLTPSPYVMSPGMPVSTDSLGSAFGAKVSSHKGAGPGGAGSQERTKDQMAEILKELIKNTIAKDKWEDMGGTGSIQYFPMGLALVINQPQEVQEDIQRLLETLRKLQDLQVSVELRAVLVSETFFERIGVDFNMNITTPTSPTEAALTTGNFVPAPFVNRVGQGVNLVSGLTQAGTLTPDLNIPIQNNTFAFTTPQFGGYQPQAGLNLGLAFLSDIQVFMFLQAVQGDRRAHIMQSPKITVYNGQTAFISGNMVRPSVTGLNPVPLANGQMIMIPNIAPIPFGLAMQVQPVVSPDRRFIRLNVTPIMANGIQDPAGAIVVAVPSVAVGQFDGGVAQPPFANSQVSVTVNPTQANLNILNTTVNVPDGGTVLLGGFKFLAEERTEYGPPILSKIPYLSRLFRNVGWSRDGSTLIYLVTARVIMIEEEERIFLGELPAIPGR
jgi:type II secretory pathway component GspD/PulD (secretin)